MHSIAPLPDRSLTWLLLATVVLAVDPSRLTAATGSEMLSANETPFAVDLRTSFSSLPPASAWNSERRFLWEAGAETAATREVTDVFHVSPTVGDHSVSVSGGGAVTSRGFESWRLGLSASEDADHRIDPEAAESASLNAFTLERSYTDKGFLRLGRYQADQLAAVGRLDGFQGEMRLRENVSGGVMAGFRSRSPSNLETSEPVAVAYLLTQLQATEQLRYSGAFGFLGSAYEGNADRAALLVEQQATVAGKLALEATTEIDLDAFSDLEQHAAPLTRLRLSASLPVNDTFTLRAGVRRDRRPDTRAERELSGGTDDEYTEGTWTHWAGVTKTLAMGFEVGGEIALRDGVADEDNGADGSLSVTRLGLPLLPRATSRASVYTRGVGNARATAARLTTETSCFDGRVSLQPSVTVSLDAPQDSSAREDAVALRAQWNPGAAWRVAAGASYRTDGFAENEPLVEVGYQAIW